MSETLLNAADVAARWGVGRSWVEAEARAGRLPHTRFGRRLRFTPEQVEAAERAHAKDVTPDPVNEWGLRTRGGAS